MNRRPKLRWLKRRAGRILPDRLKAPEQSSERIADALEHSMQDTGLLLSYAGRFGVSIDSNLLSEITRTRHLFANGRLSPEDEAAFYRNFIALSKAAFPVTARSLRSCTVKQEFRRWIFLRRHQTAADRLLDIYRLWGFIALITLMVVQTYWVVGSYLIANIPMLNENSEFPKALENLAKGNLTESQPRPPYDPLNKEKAELALEREKNGILAARDYNYEWLLDVWVAPAVRSSQWLNRQFKVQHETKESPNAFWRAGTLSKEVLSILQTYVLPPLYGWVGATAYVLRRVMSEINARTYQEESDTSYNLRIYLGILAGLAIGWFIVPSTKTGGDVLQALSPLALAFLAGYSVELLFSAMDRLLDAFSGKTPSSPGGQI
jgi:hypothetical protein